MKKRNCKDCGQEFSVFASSLYTRCYSCMKKRSKARPRRQIAKRGKVTLGYERWRDTVGKPYLDKTYGIGCAMCGIMPQKSMDSGEYYRHEVDHILGRGSHPHLRQTLTNIQYLCFDCHRKKTDHKV